MNHTQLISSHSHKLNMILGVMNFNQKQHIKQHARTTDTSCK